MLQFFCFYGSCSIVAGRNGLSQVHALLEGSDADDDYQDSHDGRNGKHEHFALRQIDFKHVEEVCPEDNDRQNSPGEACYPNVAGFAHAADNDGRNSQGNDSQQLVGYAEDRPNRGQAALQYDVTPSAGY